MPVIGLVAVVMALCGLIFWQYMGHDAAYVATQEWVQLEFGSFKASPLTDNAPHASHLNAPAPVSANANASMINLTDEATPDLQIDRHLTIKNEPAN